MKIIIVVALVLIPTIALAEPVRQTYRDANGRELGRSTTDARGNTVYPRRDGPQHRARSVTSGGTTTIYDQMGRQVGSDHEGPMTRQHTELVASRASRGRSRGRHRAGVPRCRRGCRAGHRCCPSGLSRSPRTATAPAKARASTR